MRQAARPAAIDFYSEPFMAAEHSAKSTTKKVLQQPTANLTPRSQDRLLTPELLPYFRLFRELKKPIPLERLPGTMVLRHYRAGEVICRQGEAGFSAFYLPHQSDVAACLAMQSGAKQGGGSPGEETQDEPNAELATVIIMLDEASAAQGRRSWWPWGKRSSGSGGRPEPDRIPVDGPEDIDRISGIASLREGDVFGEATCLHYTPRSATVIATRDCYVIEFLRNILDHLCRDPVYRQRLDEVYRSRALKGHLRQLPLFSQVDDSVLDELRQQVELEFVDSGAIVLEEGAPGDCLYLVRRGVIQVIKGLDLDRLRVSADDVSDWNQFCQRLLSEDEVDEPQADRSSPAPANAGNPLAALAARKKKKSKSLAEWLRERGASQPLQAYAAGEEVSESDRATLLTALNDVIHNREFLASLPDDVWQRPGMARELAKIPSGIKGIRDLWTDLQIRTAGRLAIHTLYPDIVRPLRAPRTVPQVLAYLSQGECFGELGVLGEGSPRTATCIVYEHGQSGLRTQAELVRVDGAIVRKLAQRSPPLQAALSELADRRKEELRAATDAPASAAAGFQYQTDAHGIAEGQQLLLIDLDRCTRCGDCVRACVGTHDDGRTRLFLDGPRQGRYLIPSACRQCVDPVCMIGCPVGAIHRGDRGEIRIESWCIGCELCSKQCPFDSIQMHDVGLVGKSAVWRVAPFDFRGSGPGVPRGSRRQQLSLPCPVLWARETQELFQASCRDANDDRRGILLEHEFRCEKGDLRSASECLVTVTTPGLECRMWLNGTPRELDSIIKRKQVVGYEARLPVAAIRKNNRLTVALQGDAASLAALTYGAELFSLRIDGVPPVEELNRLFAGVGNVEPGSGASTQVEVKLVEQRAVVCDLCAHLAGGPACVAMCPHDAAIRVNGREELGVRL